MLSNFNKKVEYRCVKLSNVNTNNNIIWFWGLKYPCPDVIKVKKIIVFEVGTVPTFNMIWSDLFNDVIFYGVNSLLGQWYTYDFDLSISNNKRNIEGSHNIILSPFYTQFVSNQITCYLFLEFETYEQ